MANHKRKRRKGSALCGLCKPHKKPGCRKKTCLKSIKEKRAIIKTKDDLTESY